MQEKIILLDTSGLLTAIKDHIDIVEELKRILNEPFILKYSQKTHQELEGKKDQKLAQELLKVLKAEAIPIEDSKKNVDTLLREYAESHPGTLVFTQDKKLKEKLKKGGVGVITIRQKKYLQITA